MDMQKITNTKFFENYGNPIGDVQITKNEIAKGIEKNFDNALSTPVTVNGIDINTIVVAIVSAAAFSAGAYLILNNTKMPSNVFARS